MSMKRAAASGATWTGISTALITGLQFLQLAVLARLLAPEDFGLMAMALIVLGFGQVIADLGIGNAIIHRQDTTRGQLSSLYWLTLLAGLLLFGIVVAAAPLVADLFGEPRLNDLTIWAACVLLIAPLGQQFQIVLQKELRFKALGAVDVAAAVTGAATAIGCAIAGQGVFSLVWGRLADTAAKSAISILLGWSEWRPDFHFRRRDLGGYLSFGLYQVAERSANYFGSRLDQLLIGTMLGAQALGYYSLAFNLVMLPVLRLNPVLTRVAFPLLARVQDEPARLQHGFMVLQRALAVINFPLLVGLAAVAPGFVLVVVGEQWTPSVVLIQVLAFVALLRSTGNPTGSLLLAKGRADLGFYWTILFVITQSPAIYLGARYGGAFGVAIALLAMQLIYYWVNYYMNVRRLLGPCLRPHLGSIAPALITAGLMGMAVMGVSLLSEGVTSATLALQVGFGAVLYLGLNWLLFRSQARQVIGLIGAARA